MFHTTVKLIWIGHLFGVFLKQNGNGTPHYQTYSIRG